MVRTSILLIAVMALLLVSCGSKDEIATAGNSTITKSEFIDILKNRYPNEKDYKNIDLEKKKEILDQVVYTKLKVQAAIDLGLEKDEEISKAIEKQEENLLGQKYFEKVIVDKLIPEKEIDQYIERQGIELKVSYILIGHEKSSPAKKRTREEAKTLAEKVVADTRQGTDFKELALKYSDDPMVQKNNGDVGYFRWGQKPREFQKACWDLKVGEISDPVETQLGYNVIRLDDRKEIEGYEPDRSDEGILRIKQTLYSAMADSGRKMWDDYYKKLQESKSFKIYPETISAVQQIIEKATQDKRDDIQSFSDDEKNMVLTEWDDNKVIFNTILTRYDGNLLRVFTALSKKANLDKEVNNLSMIKLVINDAKEMDLDKEKSVASVLNKYKEDRLSSLVEKKEVNDKITFTDEEVKEFYDQHPDQFMLPAQMEIWDIVVETEQEAKKVSDLAKKGRNFEDLAKKYSTDKYYKDKGGYQGFRTVNARGSISQTAFQLGPDGKISDPIKYRKNWAVLKTGEMREQKLRPFREVKTMVEGRLRSEKTVEKRKEWKTGLYETYSVNINEEALINL